MSTPNNSNAVVFKAPSGPLSTSKKERKKKPVKTALDEDEFTEALTTIVQRDFFPDVAKLETQLEFIEATETNNYERLREISERFASTSHTPVSATPSTFETPPGTPLATAKLKRADNTTPINQKSLGNQTDPLTAPDTKKAKPEDGKSLDQFLFKYHSEDDASFEEILDKSAKEHQRKHAWLYVMEKEYQNSSSLPSSGQRLAITDGPSASSGQGGRHDGSGVETWNYTAKNSLMYIPEGVEDSVKESLDKAIKHREIVHSNTRLSRDFLHKTSAAFVKTVEGQDGPSSKASHDKVGVDGKVLAESETPRVNGYGFLATPQIHPGVDASPLMTWGTIDGTPLRLDTDIVPTTAPAFKMPDIPKREAMGIRLAEKAAKASKERKRAATLAASPAMLHQKLGGTPTVTDRLQMLSPAARKLVTRTSTPGRTKTDHALIASYTPKHTSTSVTTPQRDSSTNQSGSSTPSLTDNLLQLVAK